MSERGSAVASGAASGAATGTMIMPGWGTAIGAVLGAAGAYFGSKKTSGQKALGKLAKASYTDWDLQKFLPPELRYGKTGGMLSQGIAGIGDLTRNPGRLGSNVEGAIAQRLGIESEGIAGNFRGIRSQQEGMGARTNLPVSIKGALASALDVAQERAQRDARRGALMDSDQLRRQDLSQTYSLLDTILQFMSSGRGQTIPGLGANARMDTDRRAALYAGLGSTANTLRTDLQGAYLGNQPGKG